MGRAAIGWTLGALVLGLSSQRLAHGYCLSSTCAEHRDLCAPSIGDNCGQPLRWKRECVGFSVQAGGSKQVSAERAASLLGQAFGTWTSVACEEGRPALKVLDLGPVQCDAVQFNAHGANANVLIFRDEAWPYPASPDDLALSTVTYSVSDGEILDVDIEINSYQFRLTTTESTQDHDLLGVLTHEAGHFLGIGHSREPEATMFGQSFAGSTSMRTLIEDDEQALCALYGGQSTFSKSACDPTPYHGFSSQCSSPSDESGCSAASAPGQGHEEGRAAFLLLGLWFCRRRRAKS